MAYAELHLLDSGTSPRLIQEADNSLALVARASVLWIHVSDQPR